MRHPRGRPRIAHVTTAHPATDNRILRKECISLAEAGFEVHLLATDTESGTVSGVCVNALPKYGSRLRRMLLGPLTVWRKLICLRPDVVHVHDPELIPLAILWRAFFRTPTIYDSHEDLPKQVMAKPYLRAWLRPAAVRLARGLELAADRFLDAVVVATPSIARNFDHAAVALVQNFPWARDFADPTALDPNCNDVVYVGAITETRGALEMMQAVERSAVGARLILAGPLASTAVSTEIERCDATVKYLGYLPVRAVPQVIQATSIGLVLLHPLPNYVESQPTKLFEYMAAGRPFIASDFASWRELLGDAECGVFIDPYNVEALRDAIDHLLTHPDEATALGRTGRATFEKHFSFESQAANLVALVEHLVDS